MAMPDLMALSGPPPASGRGPVPFAPPKTPRPPGPGSNGDAENATLGQLAMAFKEATDPRDAAAFLLEFLQQAGVARTK